MAEEQPPNFKHLCLRHPNSKLTVNMVQRMRRMYRKGFTYKEISVVLDIKYTLVYDVVNRKTWKHVE